MAEVTVRVFRGDSETGKPVDYKVPLSEGMVVLDAIHSIQANQAPDLAVRWNCKAAKCGSCSAEVNGKPRLMCKTRMDSLPLDQPVTVVPDEIVSAGQGPGHRRLVELQGEQKNPGVSSARRAWNGRCTSETWTACRSSGSASNASCARTCVTCCASTIRRSSSAGRVFSCGRRGSKCIRSTGSIEWSC